MNGVNGMNGMNGMNIEFYTITQKEVEESLLHQVLSVPFVIVFTIFLVCV